MGSNLSKSPLTAIVFAATLTFVSLLLPFSQVFKDSSASFVMPVLGYVFYIVYGLWLSLIMAIFYSQAKAKGVQSFLFATILLIAFGSFAPQLEFIILSHPEAKLTFNDTLMQIANFAAATLLITILGLMLMKARVVPATNAKTVSDVKYKIKAPSLIIKLLISPLIFCIFFFLTWYFLLWKIEAVRLFYTNGVGAPDAGFIAEIINMLLTNVGLLTFALLQGLIYFVLSIPLLVQLQGKRTMFFILNAMLYLCSAVFWLIPNPMVGDVVRNAFLVRNAALMLVYSIFTGLMQYTSLKAITSAVPPAKAAVAPKEPSRKK